MNRSERRIFTQVHECFPRKRQYVLREAIHTLAQQGIIEYEAAQASHAKSTVNVWLAQESVCSERDSLHKEILTLRAELDRVHDERSSDNHNNCKKETTMAKLSIDVQNVTFGGNIVIGSATLSVEVPDDAFATMAEMYERCLPIIFGNVVHACKCEASNGDKRPGTTFTPTPKPDNAFIPTDMD